MLYALAMGACSMTYAVTFGHAVLYAYRIGLCHTKVRPLATAGVRGHGLRWDPCQGPKLLLRLWRLLAGHAAHTGRHDAFMSTACRSR